MIRGDSMPKEIHFNALFDDVINRLGSPNLGLSSDQIQALRSDFNSSKIFMLRNYDGVKSRIKGRYMEDPAGLLDRHKCAASFMVATMNELKLDNSAHLNKSKYLKEKVAIVAGLSVLRTFIVGDNANYKNAGIIAFLDENDGFKFPEVISDHKPYHQNWALELHYAYKEDKLFVPSLSHQLFCIERHNMQLLEIESLKNQIKNLSS